MTVGHTLYKTLSGDTFSSLMFPVAHPFSHCLPIKQILSFSSFIFLFYTVYCILYCQRTKAGEKGLGGQLMPFRKKEIQTLKERQTARQRQRPYNTSFFFHLVQLILRNVFSLVQCVSLFSLHLTWFAFVNKRNWLVYLYFNEIACVPSYHINIDNSISSSILNPPLHLN